MKERQSCFSGVFLAPVILLTVLLITDGPFSPVSAQQADSYKTTAGQAPSMADAPLEFQVISARQMINGAYQYTGWTPKIRGRMLGRTRRGDAIVVELSQDGKMLAMLRAGLS